MQKIRRWRNIVPCWWSTKTGRCKDASSWSRRSHPDPALRLTLYSTSLPVRKTHPDRATQSNWAHTPKTGTSTIDIAQEWCRPMANGCIFRLEGLQQIHAWGSSTNQESTTSTRLWIGRRYAPILRQRQGYNRTYPSSKTTFPACNWGNIRKKAPDKKEATGRRKPSLFKPPIS